jgi:phosphoglycolate phosphatase
MKYRLVIFDLDGTLVDSFPWFLSVVNSVADRHGFRRMESGEVDELRGLGSREIVARMQVPMWKIPFIATDMRRMKADCRAPLFPGIDAMLERLVASGVTLALVTSDSEQNARRALGASARHVAFFDCGASLFGKAAKFRRVVKRAGFTPSQAISIGDEVRDIEAARAAGIACGAVMWGYAAPDALRALAPDLVFERLEDVAGLLTSKAPA